MDERYKAFIEEIIGVCQKYGVSISHEDGQGSFNIEPFEDFYSDWLRAAWINPVLREDHLQADNTASSSAE